MLTPTQRRLTEEREQTAPLRRRWEELQVDPRGTWDDYSLNDDGHRIRLMRDEGANEAPYQVEIDGQPVNDGTPDGARLAEQLWKKYAAEVETAKRGRMVSPADIDRAQKEVLDEAETFRAGTAKDVARHLLDE